jgi:hypothetical protein
MISFSWIRECNFSVTEEDIRYRLEKYGNVMTFVNWKDTFAR